MFTIETCSIFVLVDAISVGCVPRVVALPVVAINSDVDIFRCQMLCSKCFIEPNGCISSV
jgi:hypothetical protein